MSNIGFFDRFRNRGRKPGSLRLDMVVEQGNGFYAWNGKLFRSDIVLSAVRPKVKAVGKLVGKQLRKTPTKDGNKLETDPDPRIKLLLEEPNPYMTGQDLQEKLAMQLCLNNNAFALIIRDSGRLPAEVFPLPCNSVDVVYNKQGDLSLRFYFPSGKNYVFPYTDIIHLRQDFYENDIFGSSLGPTLAPLMDVVTTTDRGIVRAIRNSSVIRWLLKYSTSQRPEDLTERAKEFSKSYLQVTEDENSVGVAAIDPKTDAIQVKPEDYVPNAAQMDRTRIRILSLFNTNEKIIQSDYDEDEYNAYYEAEIVPVIRKLQSEYTRKIFSWRDRGAGNSIVFDSAIFATASMSTKLSLTNLVDRGIITPNEHRAILNLAPIPGGDVPVRRLDTVPVTGNGEAGSGETGEGEAAKGGDDT